MLSFPVYFCLEVVTLSQTYLTPVYLTTLNGNANHSFKPVNRKGPDIFAVHLPGAITGCKHLFIYWIRLTYLWKDGHVRLMDRAYFLWGQKSDFAKCLWKIVMLFLLPLSWWQIRSMQHWNIYILSDFGLQWSKLNYRMFLSECIEDKICMFRIPDSIKIDRVSRMTNRCL